MGAQQTICLFIDAISQAQYRCCSVNIVVGSLKILLQQLQILRTWKKTMNWWNKSKTRIVAQRPGHSPPGSRALSIPHSPIAANIIPPGFMICMPANRWEISKPFVCLSTRFPKPNIVVARSISLLDRWKYYCNSYRFFAPGKKQWIDEINQKLGL